MADEIFQTLIIGLRGHELTPEEERLLSRRCPGGVILFGRNVESPEQVAELCAAVYRLCERRPLIAIDQEGGSVDRLRKLLSATVSPAELAKRGDPGIIRRFGHITGELLAALGVNLNLAPVVDLRTVNADNALRGRCWGSGAEEVAERASAFLGGLDEAGVRGCIKHFPGLGRAAVDSHHELPVVSAPLGELLGSDVQPYFGLAARAAAVMVAHCRYADIDGDNGPPASLSPRVYGLLREKVGFAGVAITDDLGMGALDGYETIAERITLALNAGADMLPICSNTQQVAEAFDSLERIARERLVPTRRLREAAGRVLAAKENFSDGFEPDARLAARFAGLDEKLVRLRRELDADADKSWTLT